MAGAALRCAACGAAMERSRSVCFSCGEVRWEAEAVAKDVALEAANSPSRPFPVAGVVVALCAYAAAVGVAVTTRALDAAGPEALRGLDAALLGVGLLVLASRWRVHKGLLGLPSLSVVGVFYALLGLMSALVASVLLLALYPENAALVVRAYEACGASPWVALLDRAVLHATAEEVVLRGVVLAGLGAVLRPNAAAVASALGFAACAPSLLLAPQFALLGYVLARVRLGTGNLYAVVILRMLYEAAIVWLQW